MRSRSGKHEASTPGKAVLAPGVQGREVWAWAMYDFANSSFTTVVITAIFNAYFVAVVAGGKPWATFAWTVALALSNLLLMLAGPLIGAYADLRASQSAARAFVGILSPAARRGEFFGLWGAGLSFVFHRRTADLRRGELAVER